MKFKDFLGPNLFSRTCKAVKMRKFQDFQGLVGIRIELGVELNHHDVTGNNQS